MKKKNILIIIIVVLSAALIGISAVFISYVFKSQQNAERIQSANLTIDTNATDEEKKQEQDPLAGRMVFFAGIEDCSVNSQSVIYLENLAENEDFLMRYEVYEGDNLVFETDLIPSGKYVEWKAAENLTEGEHNLKFKEIPYYPTNGDYTELTSGVNEVTITVLE